LLALALLWLLDPLLEEVAQTDVKRLALSIASAEQLSNIRRELTIGYFHSPAASTTQVDHLA